MHIWIVPTVNEKSRMHQLESTHEFSGTVWLGYDHRNSRFYWGVSAFAALKGEESIQRLKVKELPPIHQHIVLGVSICLLNIYCHVSFNRYVLPSKLNESGYNATPQHPGCSKWHYQTCKPPKPSSSGSPAVRCGRSKS